MSERDSWTSEWQEQIEAEAGIEIDRAVELAEGLPAFQAADIFDAMFEDLPPHLRRQRGEASAGRDQGAHV